jgi:hypothetical protein
MAMSPAPERPVGAERSVFRTFVGLLVAVVAVAGLTAAAALVLDLDEEDADDDVATATTVTEPLPPPGQSIVSGTVTSVHVEGAAVDAIPTPFEVTTPERGFGAGATFEGVTVDEETASIQWNAGTPLVFESDGGALVVGPVVVDADAAGIAVLLDGPAHAFRDGAYALRGSVAVGVAGIADPRDSVEFTAGPESTVTFAGGARTVLAPQAYVMRGPGRVVLTGQFTVKRSDGSVRAVAIELPNGPFEVTLTPAEGGYAVEATLQGDTISS